MAWSTPFWPLPRSRQDWDPGPNSTDSGSRVRVARLEIGVRIGVHSAEVERRGSDLDGIGVVVAARVMDSAGGGQILVSSTVRSILLGSSWRFESAGTRALKGIDGDCELYELA